MAGLIPESVTHLQAVSYVSDAELKSIGRDRIIREEAKKLSEMALMKMLNDCIKTEGDYMGYKGNTLRLDVYILSPTEMHTIIARAREQGERDAMRWMAPITQTQTLESRPSQDKADPCIP